MPRLTTPLLLLSSLSWGGEPSNESALQNALWEWAKQKSTTSSFKVLDTVFNPNAASISVSRNGARIRYRHKQLGACHEGFLDLAFSTENEKIMVREDQLLAVNCCVGKPCPARTPAGWLMEAIDASSERTTTRLLKLIDGKHGVLLNSVGEKPKTVTFQQIKSGADFWKITFNPLYDTIDCPKEFSQGEARCQITAGGESTHYLWKGDSKKAYLKEIGLDYSH